MNLAEVRKLIRLRRIELDRDHRVLARCHEIEDLRRAARKRLPRPVFGYVDGGADAELTLAANSRAFQARRFYPRVGRDVSHVDISTPFLGITLPAPLGLAPTGYTRMMHPAGEIAVAQAARSAGLPYALSTVGTTTIEDLAATGHPNLWFQLYVLRDRARTNALIDRAAAANFKVLEVALDTPVSGRRLRDLRYGLTIPPSLTLRALIEIAAHPGYWSAVLKAPAFSFANLETPGASIEEIGALFDPAVSWDDVAAVRERWHGRLLVKGPLGPQDAAQALAVGADGIHLSNHGGRQLDRCAPTLELLPRVRDAVGDDAAIVLDSGIRHGADIVTALCDGADLCMVGRAYLYGLAAAGRSGVTHAIRMLSDELTRTLQLLGIRSIAELHACGAELISAPASGEERLPRPV